MADTEALQLSSFQERVLAVPECYDLFLGGGRGGGKSFALALLALRHAEQFGESSRILYLRQTFPGVADFVSMTRELFAKIYGTAASYNQSSHVWTLPNGAYFEINQLETPADYSKFQGRSFSLLLIDEAGQWPEPAMLDMVRSNLRGQKGLPIRVVIAANPGGVGHQWIAQRFVFKTAQWEPFHEDKSGREWIYCPSLYLDNEFIDRTEYKGQIEAATATDPELGRAWLEGDWTVARGAFFGGVLEESRNCIDPWPRPPGETLLSSWWSKSNQFNFYLTYDHGSTAVAVAYVVWLSPGAEGPDKRFYPRSSIVLVDEMATNEPGSLTKGMGYTVPQIADELRTLAKSWQMRRAEGVADDACFAQHGHTSGSIADEFQRCEVQFKPARKADRLTGWERMRRLLADAGKPDVPGLYVSRACEYFWATVPFLGRDPRRVEDLDTRSPDHAADAVRYACTGPQTTTIETLTKRML